MDHIAWFPQKYLICKRCSFECDIGKYSTYNTLFLGHVLYFFIPHENEHCLHIMYSCIFSHDCPIFSTGQRSVQSTDMTDDHKVVNRRRSVIPRECEKWFHWINQLWYNYDMRKCIVYHRVGWETLLQGLIIRSKLARGIDPMLF